MFRSTHVLNENTDSNKSQTQDLTSTSGDTTSNIDLKKIFEEFVSGENRFPYDYFLNFVKQKQTNTQFLREILQKMRFHVHILDPKLFETTLGNLIFVEIKWSILHSKNELVLAALAEFLIDLNSAYTSYIYKCLTMLIKNFQVCNSGKFFILLSNYIDFIQIV